MLEGKTYGEIYFETSVRPHDWLALGGARNGSRRSSTISHAITWRDPKGLVVTIEVNSRYLTSDLTIRSDRDDSVSDGDVPFDTSTINQAFLRVSSQASSFAALFELD
ncbi:hypothetical protein FHS20_003995 [Phyllobacterium endophyticum]|uniref:Uncharacterized protein n=1 Tax=Phyllobacterium endophyticum TaxID=1149773 RepID=A0A2P7AKC9_9HYPH|nr:hypothetical protein [Phyllobacterium endophyticum]PSH54666.1 hypothetical protein CU100_26185 [Phyllobacterium endophyticum]